jgi:hypothetical protein
VRNVGRNILHVAALLADSLVVIILDFFSGCERNCGCNLRRVKWWCLAVAAAAAVFVVRKNMLHMWICGTEMLIVQDLSSLQLGITR